MKFVMKLPLAVTALTFGFILALAIQTHAAMPAAATTSGPMLAQAMVPKMADQSRHKSMDTLRGTSANSVIFKDHAGTGLL